MQDRKRYLHFCVLGRRRPRGEDTAAPGQANSRAHREHAGVGLYRRPSRPRHLMALSAARSSFYSTSVEVHTVLNRWHFFNLIRSVLGHVTQTGRGRRLWRSKGRGAAQHPAVSPPCRATGSQGSHEPKRTIGHALCCMDRAGKLIEREILAVGSSGESDHAGILLFRPFGSHLRGQEFIQMLQGTLF